MARLRNFVRKIFLRGFRAVLFRMVPKLPTGSSTFDFSFRAVLFRMVPKPRSIMFDNTSSFRAVLFRMVPKHVNEGVEAGVGFRAVLFRMVPKKATHSLSSFLTIPPTHNSFLCRKGKRLMRQKVRLLQFAGWYYTSVFLL